MNNTLLEIVNNILSSLNIEEVNSIDDIPEATQLVNIIEETYYNILSSKDFEINNKTFSLISLSDTTTPTKFKIPEDVIEIKSIKYLSGDKYNEITLLDEQDFLNITQNLSNKYSLYKKILKDPEIALKIGTNKDPEYCTSFDENYIVFDSFNIDKEDTLQEKNFFCYGSYLPKLKKEDDYKIDLPRDMLWSYFIPEVKSTASIVINGSVNQKEEQKSRRGRFSSYHNARKTKNTIDRKYKTYGRKTKK